MNTERNLNQLLDKIKTDEERMEEKKMQRLQNAYRTELCRAYMNHGRCQYGDACGFAHHVSELLIRQPHPNYKTRLCRNFYSNGFCPYGSRCQFIHSRPQPFGNGPPSQFDQSFTPPSQPDMSFTPPYGSPSPLDPVMQLNGRYPPPLNFGLLPPLDPAMQRINGFGEPPMSPTYWAILTNYFMPPRNALNFEFPIHNQV